MIDVATYQSQSNWSWLGYPIINGEILWVRFEGATEAEVIDKARTWYDNEASHQRRLIGKHEIDGGEVSSKPYKNDWANPRGAIIDNGVFIPAKEHALAGSVWLIHHTLKKKGRFPAAEVDAMLAQGWEKAGPRTAFKEGEGW